MILEVSNILVAEPDARRWCGLPYPGHPGGCPNFGKKPTCPPRVPEYCHFMDVSRPLWFVVARFDLADHLNAMRRKHPVWSDRQLRCVLYYQPKIVKALKQETEDFVKAHPGSMGNSCPEALGLNIFQTLLLAGVEIETHPVQVVHKVALVGYPRWSDPVFRRWVLEVAD